MTTTREEWLAGGSRVQVPGTPHTLFVRQDRAADGRPVTLLHGFPTSSHDWADVTTTSLVAHDYGVSVAQELLALDSKRITSMVWLNGGLFPDLHRPTRGQKLLRSRIGPLVARLFDEARFAAAIREILGRPVSDETMHDMWLSMSARDGARTSPRLDEPPAVGHYPQVEAPEVVGPLIAGFVS